MQEDFLQNEILKRATAMSVINIGELVKNLTIELKKEFDEIPWKTSYSIIFCYTNGCAHIPVTKSYFRYLIATTGTLREYSLAKIEVLVTSSKPRESPYT